MAEHICPYVSSYLPEALAPFAPALIPVMNISENSFIFIYDDVIIPETNAKINNKEYVKVCSMYHVTSSPKQNLI